MKIRLLSDLLSENQRDLEMHYFAFDFDDNILHMPTKILMDKKTDSGWEPVDVSTTEFTVVRNDKENYRLRDNDPGKAFSEFRDTGSRGKDAFLIDTKNAIESNNYGPSWKSFIKCLTDGSLFAIITARGHEPESIRKAIEWMIDNILTEEQKFLMYSHCLKFAYYYSPHDVDYYSRIPRGKFTSNELIKYYLDNCYYYGVASDSFAKEFGEATSSNPEAAKQLALDKFIEKCNEFGAKIGAKSVSLGFSDDDPKNVEHIKKFFKEKSSLMIPTPHELKLSVFSTVNREIQGGIKTKFNRDSGTLNETQSSFGVPNSGLESSVLPFSSWNAMTKNLYPSTADAPQDDFHNHFKNKIGQLGDLTKSLSKKLKTKNEKRKKVRKVRK